MEGSAGWASLPADLVQRACAALEPQDRRCFLGVCSGWQAALAAAPHLAPPLVLRGPPLKALQLQFRDEYSYEYEDAVEADTQAGDAFLLSVAALHPKTWSVWLEGCQEQPSAFVAAALLLLPPSVRVLDLAVPCRDPVLAALARRSQLESLSISGNAVDVSWRTRDAPAVLAKLHSLRLDYYEPSRLDDESERMDPEVLTALAAGATALTRLTFDSYWTDDVGRLITALPALRSLRLNLRHCLSDEAAVAVHALTRASGLECLSLCIASGDGGEDAEERGQPASTSYWYGHRGNIEVPPLACLAPVLTELRLLCNANLPTDWRRLRNLRRLHMRRSLLDGSWLPFGLARLCQLTMLRIDAQPPAVDTLAALPALKVLQLFRNSMHGSRYYFHDGKLASLPCPSAPEFEAELAQKLPNLTLTWLD